MSSKRGRKRNDNLPPNRARDVQRAFRARRAAHLQALELRVSELEEENNCLRAALNLPAANRPSLGKGPTGKDKPKSLESTPIAAHSTSSKSRESSPVGASPSPERSESASPSVVSGNMRTPPVMDGHWEESFMMGDQQSQASHVSSTSSASYNLRPVPPSMSQKSPHQFTFSNPMPPPPRSMISSSVSAHPIQPGYTQTADRPIATGYNDMNYLLCDVRESPHYPYSYQQPSQFNPEHGMPPPSQHPIHSPQNHTQQRPSLPHTSITYQQRRSVNEPSGFRSLGADLHLPSPPPHQQAVRLASPPAPSPQDPRSHYISHGKHPNALR
ncbi:hypothetical protein K503DRAFT_719249 [Rhizopogon vinicolor AM-OR11-026]|uniref:BZIP domain-containing protein n=1 Tax=Rhizopogon vinicolor AM-OR11-026 TaxID=1314800 RepID=A0A1B7MYV3_9AGAM|nr:hypothetical protein K503DRAFT_719249 [Rhizopogon vinicolor AM-OR11-026]